MANTKSATKRIRRISRQTVVNKKRRSRFKSAVKKNEYLVGPSCLYISFNLD